MTDKPDAPIPDARPAAKPDATPQPPASGVVTVGATPDDDPRRARPTPEGDDLSPTRYGDWEQNGHCIDF